MSYTLKIEQSLKNSIASWGIPIPVLRDFYLRAVDVLEAPTGRFQLLPPTPDDLQSHYKYVISVDDYTRAGCHYEFFLGVDLRETEMWIVQCDSWLVDVDGNIAWSSDGA